MFVSSLRSSSVRFAGWLLIVVLSLFARGLSAQTGTPSAFDGFDPRPNSVVLAVAVQPDGKTVFGGVFTGVAPKGVTALIDQSYLSRVNLDGSLDTTFQPTLTNPVSAVAVQPDGRLLVATYFNPSVDELAQGKVPTAYVIRLLPNGQVDSTFEASVTSNTFSGTRINRLLLQSDGKVVVGGTFTKVIARGAETARTNLVRLNSDGSLDSGFTTQANAIVTALVQQDDGKILVGGGFTTAQVGTADPVSRGRLMRLNSDGSLDTSFDTQANDLVSALAIGRDRKIYVGGSFTSLKPKDVPVGQEVAVGRLARLKPDGSVDDAVFHPVMNGSVLSLAVEADGSVLVGGAFTTHANYGASYSVPAMRLVRFAIDGALDTTFSPAPDDEVTQIVVLPDGRFVIGGRFLSINTVGLQSTTRPFLARLAANGMPDVTFDPTIGSSFITTALEADGNILVAGAFSNIAGSSRQNLARLSATGVVDKTFTPVINGAVTAVAVQADKKIVVGGTFSRVNGVTRNNLARLNADGSLDTAYDPNVGGTVAALALQSDGKLLVGGEFITFQPNGATTVTYRYYVGRLNTDGTVDTTFDPHANSTVSGFAVQSDGSVIMIGTFTTMQPDTGDTSYSRTYIARFSGAGKIDQNFAVFPNAGVNAVALQADGKILIGGGFTALVPSGQKTAVTKYYLARLETSGALDTAFKAETSQIVTAIRVQADKKIVVGGAFITARKDPADKVEVIENGVKVSKDRWDTAERIVRFAEDGTIDTGFPAGFSSTVSHLNIQSDGRVLALGSFTGVKSQTSTIPHPSTAIARVTAAGVYDATFVPQVGTAEGSVRAIAQQLDGRIFLGGSFGGNGTAGAAPSLGGASGGNLVRVRANGTGDASFNPRPDLAVNAVAVLPPRDLDLALQRPFVVVGPNAQLLPSFNTSATLGISGTIFAILRQSDGSLLIGGSFQLSGDSSLKNLVRFKADGTLDTAFVPEPDNTVYALAERDGQIYAGGAFTNISATARNYIARFASSNAVIDSAYNPNLNSEVRKLVFQSDGKLLVGGSFTTVQPNSATTATARAYFARFNTDGTLDTNFNPTPNSVVYDALVQSDGKIVIVGGFNTVQPNGATSTTARQFLARLNADGTLDTAWDPKANGAVSAIVQQADGKFLVGGSFTNFLPNGATTVVARTNLARLNTDGTVDTTYDPAPNSWVQSISLQSDGAAIVAGSFTSIDTVVDDAGNRGLITRNGVARLTAAGRADPAFNPNANGTVYVARAFTGGVALGGSFTALSPYGSVVVGGAFNNIGGDGKKNLVRLNNDGNIDSTFLPEPNGEVFALHRYADGRLLVGGAFTTIAATARTSLARFAADGTLDTGFSVTLDGKVRALAVLPGGSILIGGEFTTVNGTPRARLALLTAAGALDSSFSANANGTVLAITPLADGSVVVGGEFTQLGAYARNRLGLVLPDSVWTTFLPGLPDAVHPSFAPNLDGTVRAIVATADNGFVVGGDFTKVGTVNRSRLARFDGTASLDAAFDPGADGSVWSLSVTADAKLLVGGNFKTLGGQPRNLVGRVPLGQSGATSVTFGGGAVTWAPWGGMPDPTDVYFEYSTDDRVWTELGKATRPSRQWYWRLTGVTLPGDKLVLLRARGALAGSPGSAGFVEARGVYYGSALPTLNPTTSLVGATGAGFSFSAASGAMDGVTFSATGLPAGLSINAATGLVSGTPTAAGEYTIVVTATNGGSSISATYKLVVYASGTDSRLTALSSRAPVSGGSSVVLGLAIAGSGNKPVLLRVGGPALAQFGVSNAATRPKLVQTTLSGTVLADNEGWDGSSTLSTLFSRVGAFPYAVGSKDAAVSTALTAGTSTLFGSSATGETGVILAEIYDASTAPLADTAKFLGLSVRGRSGAGTDVLTAGVAVSGATTKRVFIRGLGPKLATYGVGDTLADPVVQVYRGTTLVASNNDWSTQAAATTAQLVPTTGTIDSIATTLGLATLAAGSKDAVILVDLVPGAYSIQVLDNGGASGNALVEVYEAP